MLSRADTPPPLPHPPHFTTSVAEDAVATATFTKPATAKRGRRRRASQPASVVRPNRPHAERRHSATSVIATPYVTFEARSRTSYISMPRQSAALLTHCSDYHVHQPMPQHAPGRMGQQLAEPRNNVCLADFIAGKKETYQHRFILQEECSRRQQNKESTEAYFLPLSSLAERATTCHEENRALPPSSSLPLFSLLLPSPPPTDRTGRISTVLIGGRRVRSSKRSGYAKSKYRYKCCPNRIKNHTRFGEQKVEPEYMPAYHSREMLQVARRVWDEEGKNAGEGEVPKMRAPRTLQRLHVPQGGE